MKAKIYEYEWSVPVFTVKSKQHDTATLVYRLLTASSVDYAAAEYNCTRNTLARAAKAALPEFHDRGTTKYSFYIPLFFGFNKCGECSEYKRTEDFHVSKTRKYGLQSKCKECTQAVGKQWYNDNKEKSLEASKAWRDSNRHKSNAIGANYRAAKLQRTPRWADMGEIQKVYDNCPEGHHVDHIIPLQGEKVSGLHVESNLQYLLASENASKGNRYKV